MRALLFLGVLAVSCGTAACMLDRGGLEGSPASSAGGGGGGGNGGTAGAGAEIPPGCGDGVVDEGEACDDGRNLPNDGCAPQCQLEDGFTCSGEPSICVPICADGLIKFPEGCDDGAMRSGDGCSNVCEVEPGHQCYGQPSECSACGDGVITGLEQCEDGNLNPADGCDAVCMFENTCGNGIIEPSEQCDDGNSSGGDGCSNACVTDLGACNNAMNISDDALAEVTIAGNVTTVLSTTTGSVLQSFGAIEACAPAKDVAPIVLHRYVIGQYPARLGMRTVDIGSPLVDTVLSAYTDCLSEIPVVCDDDGGGSKKSRLSTKVLPAGTTVYIAVTGYYTADVGDYHLEVTEQRAPLSESFPLSLGLFVAEDGGADGRTWAHCDPAAGCAANVTSGSGGYALASDNPDGDMLAEYLVSPPILTDGSGVIRVQLAFAMATAAAVSDYGALEVSTDLTTWTTVQQYISPIASNDNLDVAPFVGAAPKFWLRFAYSDGGGDADAFRIDDVAVTFF